MLVGVFIGVLVGLCLALGVALYLNRTPAPFAGKDKAAEPSKPAQAEKTTPKFEPVKPEPEKAPSQAAAPAPAAKPAEPKTRFDFYKILPGEEAVTGKQLGQGATQGSSSRVVYYLQAGAFQQTTDADNLKARLALAGLEAQIQTATLPDNSVWHRVRLGPYSNAQDLDKARAQLKENKIDAAVIKVNEPLAKR
jgi:cell division protein FtsN